MVVEIKSLHWSEDDTAKELTSLSETESLRSWASQDSVKGSMWSGFLLEEFPAYGSYEFTKLRNHDWSLFKLNRGQDYANKPRIPEWTRKLDKISQDELIKKISEEHIRLHSEQKYGTERDEPEYSEETLGIFSKSVGCSMDEIRELTKFVWQRDWLLFCEEHPKFWFQLLGDRSHATKLYTYKLVDHGNFLTGVWGLVLTEAFYFEKKRPVQWQLSRRYQNLDGSAIRPVMTIYKEMRDDLGADGSELLDLLFGTLPKEAFPELNFTKAYWMDNKGPEGTAKKRPVKVSFNILMISDIDTVLQRFNCKFALNWCWKQSLNGARLYYVKEQLDELDEMSTQKAFVFKAEWLPPHFTIRNAVKGKKSESKPPFVIDGDYTTLHSSETWRVTFSEKLELGNFPFDCQEFTMTFDFQGNDYDLRGDNEKFLQIDWSNFALNEWKHSSNAVDCTITRVASRTDPSTITVQFKLERDPSSFIYKLVFTSFMICSGTFVFFGTDLAQLGERVSYIATMFLTGQAFQVVATADTPSLGYLTMIDHFLLVSNIFVYILLIASVFVSTYASGENLNGDHVEEGDPGDKVNIYCLVFFGALYIIFCIFWTAYARFISMPAELSKLLSSPLKLPSGGLVYMLSYIDDNPRFQASQHSFSPYSVYQQLPGKLIKEQNKEIHDKITRIICKSVDQDKSIIKYLTGKKLSRTVETFKEHGFVRDPQWKEYNMEKKYAQIATKRKQNFQKRAEMGSLRMVV